MQGKERVLISSFFVHLGETHLVAVQDIDISGRHVHCPKCVLKVCIEGKEEQWLDEKGQLGKNAKINPI